MKKRLYAACAVVLVAGLTCAGWIYAVADDGPDLAGAYQIIVVNGVPQAIAPNESRAYVRDVQRFGGKLGLLLDDVARWWNGLWHGKSLALTVASLTVIAAFTMYFIAVSIE